MVVFWWSVLGLFVGSFLNVCIHRLPLEGESVNRPRRSRCPACRTTLTWKENLPVLSWLVLRGRCRTCKARISARYPLIELLTAALFWLAATRATPAEWPLVLVWVTVLAGLVVATFVDFDHFEIPDEVSIGGCFLAPLASFAVPDLHAHTRLALSLSEGAGGPDRIGALAGCFAGMAVGAGILYAIGWVGKRAYGTEAMGFGDVKLMAAGGGFVGPGGVLVALLVAAFAGSIVGMLNILRFLVLTRGRARARGRRASWSRSIRVARLAGRYIPFGPYLALGIGIALLYWEDVSALVF
jgi:leader peptidase (prepilin peptidase)/N-methyltransferase